MNRMFSMHLCIAVVVCSMGCQPVEATPADQPSTAIAPAGVEQSSCSEPWRLTGNLTAHRIMHRMVTLPDGRVLMYGGLGSGSSGTFLNARTEVYDPTTGAWSSAGSLRTPRRDHQGVLLQNGKVLVAGGIAGSGSGNAATASVELFNPATNTWSNAARMVRERSQHALALLPNGRVLAAGGLGSDGLPTASAEIYNPLDNTWRAVSDMSTRRYIPVMAVLPDGKVLVAGGRSSTAAEPASYPRSSEILDPETGLWAPGPEMSRPRASAGAALLPNGNVLVAGGYDGTTPFATAELYDHAAGAWIPTGGMASDRYSFEMVPLPGGRVLIAGGFGNGTWLSTVEIYQPSTGAWTTAASMSSQRAYHGSALLNDGRVLMGGGSVVIWWLNSSETYAPCAGEALN